jgi:hypothetical protein
MAHFAPFGAKKQVNQFGDRPETGISPAFTITAAASGEARKRINAKLASCSRALDVSAPQKSRWLHIRRDSPHERDARHMDQLGDLLEANLGLAPRHHRRHLLAGGCV